MACGLGLGILLVFLVQAEHVGCFWTTEAQNIQNSNTYVGFSPPNVILIKSGSYPQNQVRQGFISPHSIQSSSSNVGPVVYSGSSPGHSTRSSTQAVSQPAQSSVRLVQSSSVFKANRQKLSSPRANAPNVAKQQFHPPSAVFTETSVSLHQKKPSMKSWLGQQGMQHYNKSPFSTPQTIQGPRGGYSFRPDSLQSAVKEPSKVAAKMHSSSGQTGSAHLYGPVAPAQRGHSVQMQTYARGSARRVFSNRRSKESKSTRFPPQTQMRKLYVGHEGGSRPRSWLQTYKTSHNLAVPRSSTMEAPSKGLVYDIPEYFGGFAIRRLKDSSGHN